MILRYFILSFLFLFLFTEVKSQSDSNNNSSENFSDSVFTFCEIMPEFPGGKLKMMEYLSANTYFPVSCSKDNINAKYTVSFVIDTSGKVTEVSFKEEIYCKDFENVLKEMFYKMPIWQPGIHQNKKVRVKYTHPIFINID